MCVCLHHCLAAMSRTGSFGDLRFLVLLPFLFFVFCFVVIGLSAQRGGRFGHGLVFLVCKVELYVAHANPQICALSIKDCPLIEQPFCLLLFRLLWCFFG